MGIRDMNALGIYFNVQLFSTDYLELTLCTFIFSIGHAQTFLAVFSLWHILLE